MSGNEIVMEKGWVAPDGKEIAYMDCAWVGISGDSAGRDVLEIQYRDGSKTCFTPNDITAEQAAAAVEGWRKFLGNKGGEEEGEVVKGSQEQLTDVLADLVHRMMEQNVTLNDLVGVLRPVATYQADPFYVAVPGFKNLANREPTAVERQCFYAGVLQFGKRLKNFSIGEILSSFWDELGVPTMRCVNCGHRVPLERTVRDVHNRIYGIDCCGEKVKN